MTIMTNKKTKIIFYSSLALNLVLVGFIAGSFCGKRHAMMPPMPHGDMKEFSEKREERLINALPENRQEEAKKLLKQSKEARQKGFKEAKSLFAEIEKTVVADKFDQDKFLANLKKLDETMFSSKVNSNEDIAKFLATLSKEDRTKLVEEIKKGPKPFFKDHKEKGRGESDRKELRDFDKSDK